MIARAHVLYKMSVAAVFHRLRHDLGKELVVGLSSLILFATFFYVFNDFLNVEVASLSPAMRSAFAKVASTGLLLGSVTLAGRMIRQAHTAERSLATLARVMGEGPTTIHVLWILQGSTWLLTIHGLSWWVNQRWLYHVEWNAGVAIETAMTLGTLALGLRKAKKRPQSLSKHQNIPLLRLERAQSKRSALVLWRLIQIGLRSPLSRICLMVPLLLTLPLALTTWRGMPPFVPAAWSLGAGFIGSLALIFWVAEDVNQAWTERGAGVSHGEFVKAYEILSWVIGGLFASTVLLCYVVSWWPNHVSHTPNTSLSGVGSLPWIMQGLKIFLLALLPFLVVPWLMFQIDARRPSITALISFLASLFIGTAILAHGLGAGLLPLLRYYGLQSQNGRYFRA